MILRYRLLAERLRVELQARQRNVARAEGAVALARRRPAEQDYFLGSTALDLHAFYTGVERLLELIASDLDESCNSQRHDAQERRTRSQARPTVNGSGYKVEGPAGLLVSSLGACIL